METPLSSSNDEEFKKSIIYFVYTFIRNQIKLNTIQNLLYISSPVFIVETQKEDVYSYENYKLDVNQLLFLLKKEDPYHYRLFREFVGIHDNSLEPGDFYEKMYIEMSFTMLNIPSVMIDTQPKGKEEKIFLYTIDWSILFEDPEGEELVEFELSNTMYDSNIEDKLYLYENFMDLVKKECSNDTTIKKCYIDFHL